MDLFGEWGRSCGSFDFVLLSCRAMKFLHLLSLWQPNAKRHFSLPFCPSLSPNLCVSKTAQSNHHVLWNPSLIVKALTCSRHVFTFSDFRWTQSFWEVFHQASDTTCSPLLLVSLRQSAQSPRRVGLGRGRGRRCAVPCFLFLLTGTFKFEHFGFV